MHAFCTLMICAAAAPSQAQGTEPIKGPHTVLEDGAHKIPGPHPGETIPMHLYYPAEGGPWPVIHFSHGAGANKDMAPDLMRYWASHGYVVIVPTHEPDLTHSERPGLMRVIREFLQRRKLGPAMWQQRVDELKTILDALDKGTLWPQAMQGRYDTRHIGLGGHSFGAYTALLVGGAKLFGKDKVYDYRDDRIKAIVVISGPGRDKFGLTITSFHSLTLPMLVFAGSEDPGLPSEGGTAWRTQPYLFGPDGDKYLAYTKGATHVTYVGGLVRTAGATKNPVLSAVRKVEKKIDPDLAESQAQKIYALTKTTTLAFWNAYLKNDAKAKQTLHNLANQQNDTMKFEAK